MFSLYIETKRILIHLLPFFRYKISHSAQKIGSLFVHEFLYAAYGNSPRLFCHEEPRRVFIGSTVSPGKGTFDTDPNNESLFRRSVFE